MTAVFMTDPATGRVGLYQENGTTGDPFDPNSVRNAPLNSFASHLDKVKFHSDLDHLEVLAAGTKSITHALINGNAAQPGLAASFAWDAGSSDDQIVSFSNPGYVPLALVAAGGNIVWAGMQVDKNADGGARFASVIARNTEIRLKTKCTIGPSNLSAATIVYSYIVFKAPPAASGTDTFLFDETTGIVTMGFNKYGSDRAYLQVVPGGSPLGFSLGRTIDLNNGAPRAYLPDGTYYEPVQAALKTFYIRNTPKGSLSGVPGSSLAYAGSYAGPSSVLVQAP